MIENVFQQATFRVIHPLDLAEVIRKSPSYPTPQIHTVDVQIAVIDGVSYIQDPLAERKLHEYA